MSSSDSAPNYNLLDQLVDEFNDRLRRGERPSVQEFCDRHPGLAADLRDLLPAVAVVEQAKAEPLGDQPAPATLPEDFGDFHLLREVGHGGMGVVYEAEQVSLGRRVALKVLTRRLLRDDKQKRRFEREARSAGRLHHTNIVPVFGVGEHDGIPYYVMQFIRGQGLDAVIAEVGALEAGGRTPAKSDAAELAYSLVTDRFHVRQPGKGSDDPTLTAVGDSPAAEATSPFDPSMSASVSSGAASAVSGTGETGSGAHSRSVSYWRGVARIGAQVAGALDYAHQQGVIHRDIKPSNLLLDPAGTAWVTDFGLAKADGAADDLTHTGDVLGTLRYMPPEAFEGKADARSDIYALGLTLYEMLALRPAFEERNRERLVKQVTTGEPLRLRRARPGAPRDLDTIIHKAIDRDPARRYQTANELAADLRRYLDDEPIRARRQTAAEAGWRWARRHPAVACLLLVLAGVVLTGTTAVSWKWREAERNAKAADANADAAQQNAAAADASARRSQEEAQRADRAAADATEAVDQYLNTVTDDPRLREPELTPLRKELLRSAQKFYAKFVAERKNDPAARHGLGTAYQRLAILAFNIEKDHVRAMEYIQLARDTFEGLLAEAPEDPKRQAELGSCLRNVAVALHAMERHEEADAAVDRAIALQQQVLNRTDTSAARAMLASFLNYAGQTREKRNPTQALELFTQEYRLREVLAREKPESMERKYDLGVSVDRQAHTLAYYLKRVPDAKERYGVGIGLLREVARAQPDQLAWRSALGNSLRNYAHYCVLPDSKEEASKLVQEAIRHQKYAHELHRIPLYRERLRLAFKTLAEVYLRFGNTTDAAVAALDAGLLYPDSSLAAFETVELLYRCAAAVRANASFTPADREQRAQGLLDRAEPFRASAAHHTPTTNNRKLLLARWLAEAPAAPPNHLTHAHDLARQVINGSPNNRRAWAAISLAEHRLGNWYEARDAAEQAMKLAGEAGPETFVLAMTLWFLGEADAAKTQMIAAKAGAPGRGDLDRLRAEANITLGLAPAPPGRTWSVLIDAEQAGFERWLGQMSAAGFEPMFVNTVSAGGRVRYSATAASGAPAGQTWRVRTDRGVDGFQRRFNGETAEKFWVTNLTGHALADGAGYTSVWKRPFNLTLSLCRHLVLREGFLKEAEQQRGRGMRPVSVSGFAYGGQYRLTIVYGPSDGRPWEIKDGLSADDLRAKVDEWRARGFRPAVVYSYPEGGQPRFGVVLAQDNTVAGWEARARLSGQQLREEDERLRKDGFRPEQFVGYEDGGETRFVGVWVKERSPTAVPFRPMTGAPVRELAAFDRAMQTYMRERDISAGTLAVMKDGKLVLSRGYGYADKDGKVRTAPDELFRLASVSKPITAAAIYKLIAEGKLKADTLVWDLLGLAPPTGKTADPRWKKVTVAHLLDHKGGWDRSVAGDPMFKPLVIAKELGRPGPATADDVVAYMAGQPFQFDPGTKSVYSNFGYCVLGRVIEKASGRPYIDYIREAILAPLGIKRVTLGRTLPTDRNPAEPFYDDAATGPNVMRPEHKEFVPAPDGTFHLEAMDAHGGLIGSADELVRFLTVYRFDGRPAGPKPAPGPFFGALPGTFTMLYQRADGVAVVALFNRWHDPGGHDPFEIRRLIDQAADGIQSWQRRK